MSHPSLNRTRLKAVRLRVLVQLNWHRRHDQETRDAIRRVIKQIRAIDKKVGRWEG